MLNQTFKNSIRFFQVCEKNFGFHRGVRNGDIGFCFIVSGLFVFSFFLTSCMSFTNSYTEDELKLVEVRLFRVRFKISFVVIGRLVVI